MRISDWSSDVCLSDLQWARFGLLQAFDDMGMGISHIRSMDSRFESTASRRRVMALPPGFRVVSTSGNEPFAAIADHERRFYGVQFPSEVVHTPSGAALLRNFTLRA